MVYYETPGVSLAVIEDYSIAWARGYGVKAAVRSDPVTTRTLFQAAAISKPVTALAALHQVEAGKLDLDEDVNTYLTRPSSRGEVTLLLPVGTQMDERERL